MRGVVVDLASVRGRDDDHYEASLIVYAKEMLKLEQAIEADEMSVADIAVRRAELRRVLLNIGRSYPVFSARKSSSV